MSRHPNIELVEQLSRNSRPYRDPLARIDWDRLDRDSYWLPETALSLYGAAEFSALPMERRRALSQQEFLHTERIATWLEGLFMERLSRIAHRSDRHTALRGYRLHELREHVGHALVCHELHTRVTSPPADSRIAGTRLLTLLTRHAPLDSPLYNLLALICADAPDRMHRVVRQQREVINPAIYDVVNIRVVDDARHIAHARDALDASLHGRSRRGGFWLQTAVRHVFKRVVAAFYYPGPQVYERAGLKPGAHWSRLAGANPERLRFIAGCVAPTRRLLAQSGIEVGWP